MLVLRHKLDLSPAQCIQADNVCCELHSIPSSWEARDAGQEGSTFQRILAHPRSNFAGRQERERTTRRSFVFAWQAYSLQDPTDKIILSAVLWTAKCVGVYSCGIALPRAPRAHNLDVGERAIPVRARSGC